MQKTFRIQAILLVFLIIAAALAVPASAAGAEFVMNPVLPENQREGGSGFFDLMVEPGQKQELTVNVQNQSDKEIVVLVEAVTAFTNINGTVDYSASGPMDETLKYPFAELADNPKTYVTVPALSDANATVTVNIPEEPFDGIILGSICVLKEITEEEKNSDTAILNQYAYVVAVRLAENDKEIEADFALGEVKAELNYGQASIVANVRNIVPKLAKGVKATAKIYPKGSSDAVFEYVMDEVDFVPHALFPFTLRDDAGYGIMAGTYLANISLEYEGRTWNFEQEFDIKPEEAAAINQSAVNQPQQRQMAGNNAMSNLPVWTIAAISAGVLILIIAVILMMKSRADKKEYALFEERMRKLEEPTRRQPEQTSKLQSQDQDKLLEMMRNMDQDELARLMRRTDQDKTD